MTDKCLWPSLRGRGEPIERDCARSQTESWSQTLTPPLVDGKANAELIKRLSKTFKVPKSLITIQTGAASPRKMSKIDDK